MTFYCCGNGSLVFIRSGFIDGKETVVYYCDACGRVIVLPYEEINTKIKKELWMEK